MDNPLLDVVNFLQKPGWPTPVFWLLLAGGIAVATYCFVAIPDQRRFVTVCFACRSGQCGGRRLFGNYRRHILTSLAKLLARRALPFG